MQCRNSDDQIKGSILGASREIADPIRLVRKRNQSRTFKGEKKPSERPSLTLLKKTSFKSNGEKKGRKESENGEECVVVFFK